METPSFTFRLERVRDLRERAEENAREELARELQLRLRGEALLREASHAVDAARDTGSGIFRRPGASGADMLAAQAYLERAERDRREAAIDLDRQDAEVEARRRPRPAGRPRRAGVQLRPERGLARGRAGAHAAHAPTAASLGVTNVHDPVQALDGGAKYLRQQLDRFGGDVARALAAYNSGPGAVERFGGVPPYAETQEYVRRVQANAAEYRAAGSAGAAGTVRAAVLSASPSVHGIV